MLKNKEIRHLIYLELIILLLGVILTISTNKYILKSYQEEIINNNAYIVNKLIEKYPSDESLIIESLINHDITPNESRQILEKYGLDKLSNVDYLSHNLEIKNTYLKKTTITLSIIIISMFTVFIIFTKKIYKKIGDLSVYTNEILNNRYNMDIREYEEGDISNLKNDLYKMTIKLKEQNELSKKDKQYLEDTLSDISHQLKTPLTSMYVINEVLYDNEIKEDKRKELLLKNKNQLERIEWLITSLLKMSRLDSGMTTFKMEEVKLIDIINKAIEPIQIPLELKNINLIIEGDPNITAKLDPSWTSESLLNIIKNACEHTNKNGTIKITISDNPIYTEIVINDNGTGIKEEDINHIFERFYKGSNSKDSIGIGLNMSKKIINLENGDITVSSTLGKGSTFTIKFYKKVI